MDELDSLVQQYKLLPQYSSMSEDMIRQIILGETPQQSEPSQKLDLANTANQLQNIYKNIGGKEGIAKAKDFLGIMPKTSVAEKAIQAGEMMGPSMADAGLQMSNIGKAVPVGTSGLTSLLSKIGLGGGSAAGGAGGALTGLAASPLLPLAAGAGLLMYMKRRKKKKREKQRLKEEQEYKERKLEQKQELIDANIDYMETAQQYNNPYKID